MRQGSSPLRVSCWAVCGRSLAVPTADVDSKTLGDHGKTDRGMLDLFPFFSCQEYVSKKDEERKGPMKDEILLATLLLVGCLVGSSLVERSEDVASGHRRADIHPSSETSQQSNALRSLALALSSGKEEALRPFRGSRSEDDPDKDRLNPPIAGMNCYLDRIAIHVSCHSSLVDTEKEAVTLFSRLVDEVQAALPSDRWR